MTAPRRVLLIEPDAAVRAEYTRVLGADWEIEAVGSGREGIARLIDSPPSAVVCALFMSDVDGLEVLDTAGTLAPDVPVIVIDRPFLNPQGSGVDYLEVARTIGAAAVLSKPASAKALLSALERVAPV